MTITTADRLRLAPLAVAALLACAPARADWRFVPFASVTETWTDNVSLLDNGHARGQFVTDASPGFTLATNGPRLKVAAAAQWHAFAYHDELLPGTTHSQYDYKLDAQSILVDELLFLDATASGGPQAVSAFGPQVNNNLYATGNRTNVRTWRISPYLRHSFGRQANMTLQYSRDEVDTGISNRFGNSTANSYALDLASGTAWHTVGWGLSASRQDLDSEIGGKSSSKNALASLRLRLSPQWSATATGGYDQYAYPSLGEGTQGRSWSAGFIWTPSSRTRVQASYGRRYFGKTGALDASVRSRLTVWSVNYSDVVTTSRNQFLLPSTIDTAVLLDKLFTATIPNPIARALAVAAYMEATGLPANLSDSVNYLSNRYLRQKQLSASVAIRGAHSELLLTAFDTARTALSLSQSDSELLGSQLLGLNDDTRQRGLNALWNYKLNSRSSALLGATASRSRSLSRDLVTNNQMLRAGVLHQFNGKLQGALELRHVTGGLGAGSQTYHENAVSASLTSRF